MNKSKDLHICGICKKIFNDIKLFLEHKGKCFDSEYNVTLSPVCQNICVSLEENDLLSSETVWDLTVLEGVSLPLVLEYDNEEVVTGYSALETLEENSTQDQLPDAVLDENHVVSPENLNSSLSTRSQNEENITSQTLQNHLVNENTTEIVNKEQFIETELALEEEVGEEVIEETVLNKTQKHACNVCDFKTTYHQDYERHMRRHTGKQPYTCSECDEKFAQQDKLTRHQHIHSGDKGYKCQLCDYTTTDDSALRQHVRIHMDDRPYKCQMCSYRARSASHLTVHLRTHTGNEGQLIETGLALEEVFEESASNEKQKHVCNVCNYETSNHRDFVRHMRTHTGEKPYTCGACDKKFARQDKLVIHQRIHSRDKRYKCQLCDYATTDGSALRQHLRIHMDDRPYKCQMCSYRARSASHLTVHLRTHTGDSPFFCQLNTCGRTFKTSVDLKRHMKVHKVDNLSGAQSSFHGESNKKPKSSKRRVGLRCVTTFKCQYCSAAFVRQDSLRCHLKQHRVSNSPPSESVVP